MTQEEQKAVEEFTEMNLTKKGLYHYNDMQDAFLIGLFKGKKMHPSLPSNLDEAAEDSWAVYEYRESPKGLYSTCYVDGFKAGAEWMAGKLAVQQAQPKPFSCGHENGSEPKPEGIEAVVHHYANVHYLVTNTEQLNARLKQFDNDAKVLVYIEARKED